MGIVYTKARVSPLKRESIPKLELQAAAMLANLLQYVAKLNIPTVRVHPWTDSKIVLGWLKKMPYSLNTFVAHRVELIQELLSDFFWRHINSQSNPADLTNRSVSAERLTTFDLWWHGPPWLRLAGSEWPSSEVGTLLRSLQRWSHSSLLSLLINLGICLFAIRQLWFESSLGSGGSLLTANTPPTESSQILLLRRSLLTPRYSYYNISQLATYPKVFRLLKKKKPLPRHHSLAGMVVYTDNTLIRQLEEFGSNLLCLPVN